MQSCFSSFQNVLIHCLETLGSKVMDEYVRQGFSCRRKSLKNYMTFFALKIPIFDRKIETSLWKMVRLNQKLACMILVGICKKIETANLNISIFADFTAAVTGKKLSFLATEQPNRPIKSRKIKISKIHVSVLQNYI